METKVNYVVVGLFALLLSAAFVTGVLWLSADKRSSIPFVLYGADMQESVSGLNLNAPVKYRGVEVGQVRKISLNKDNPEFVRLELAIEQGIPIKQDTIATLKSQGLTGIAFIELSGGSAASPLLVAGKEAPYPLIKTGPSLLGRLDASMSGLLNSLTRTTDNINAILDDGNRHKIKQTLANLEALTGTLAANRAALEKTLASTTTTMESVSQISVQLPQLIEKISKTAEALTKMAKDTSGASNSVRKTFDDVGPDARRFANEGLPELERTLVTLRDLLASLQRVAAQVDQNPGVLLRGSETRQPGPGE